MIHIEGTKSEIKKGCDKFMSKRYDEECYTEADECLDEDCFDVGFMEYVRDIV